MGFRYRRSYKVFPGIKVNVGKKSTSVTFGGKIFRTTVNRTRGTVTRSVSTPIKGLSYQETEKIAKKPEKKAVRNVTYSAATYKVCSILVLIVGIFAIVLGITCFVIGLIEYGIGMLFLVVFCAFCYKSWRNKWSDTRK